MTFWPATVAILEPGSRDGTGQTFLSAEITSTPAKPIGSAFDQRLAQFQYQFRCSAPKPIMRSETTRRVSQVKVAKGRDYTSLKLTPPSGNVLSNSPSLSPFTCDSHCFITPGAIITAFAPHDHLPIAQKDGSVMIQCKTPPGPVPHRERPLVPGGSHQAHSEWYGRVCKARKVPLHHLHNL